VKSGLDLLRGDAKAAGGDQVITPPMVDEGSVGPSRHTVAGLEPLACQRQKGGGVGAPIAQHQARIATMHGERADMLIGQFGAVLAQHGEASAGLRKAKRALGRRSTRRAGQEGGAFRHAKRLMQRRSRHRRPLRPERFGQFLPRRKPMAQAWQA
jgi:hypothetical protein